MDIKEYIAEYNLTAKAAASPVNPHFVGQGCEMDHWLFTVGNGDRSERFYYSTGVGHRKPKRPGGKPMPVPPKLEGLLECIVLDYDAVTQSFASWCGELGMDVDSRSSLNTYLACQENADKLCRLVGHNGIDDLRKVEF